jgi:hypothetical protein
MVVGIHTVHESSISIRSNPPANEVGAGEGNAATRLGSPDAGELVFATQYRKVQFKWLSSREMDHAFLKKGCNRWKVIPLGGRTGLSDSGIDDVVEASFQDSIVEEDLPGGETYVTKDQLIVL